MKRLIDRDSLEFGSQNLQRNFAIEVHVLKQRRRAHPDSHDFGEDAVMRQIGVGFELFINF